MSFCVRCSREAELLAGPDGAMYCQSCLLQVASPRCIDCVKCYQRRCGDAIYACPFCHGSPDSAVAESFQRELKKERVIPPIRIEERCERCGGTIAGRAFILHGKALCRDCLLYEQDRWEIVPGKPGKFGTTVRIVIEKPKKMDESAEQDWHGFGKRLFHSIGVDPENPPQDPFSRTKTLDEARMADDSCLSCEARGKEGKRGKRIGTARDEGHRK
jgi:hypothetical protein